MILKILNIRRIKSTNLGKAGVKRFRKIFIKTFAFWI